MAYERSERDPHRRQLGQRWGRQWFRRPRFHVTGAGVLIYARGKVLLVHQRYSQCWGLPKGRCFRNESVDVTWKRELLEETNLNYRLLKLESHGNFISYRYRIYVFECLDSILPFPLPRDVSEIDRVRWISLADISKLHLNMPTKEALQRVFLNSNYDSLRNKTV